jgi:putative ABC transport system permease protein
MLFNYIKIAWRNALKNKLWSFINVASLALGIAACLVIFLFIQDEKSFDSLHLNKENIYRLNEVQSFPGTNTQKVALSMPGMGPALIKDYPQIQKFSRYWGRGKLLYIRGDKKLLVDESVMVDSSFLDMFDFSLLEGDKATALKEPYSMVLTKGMADNLFGNTNPLGQSITMDENDYKVSGVLQDVPDNSHMQFDALISMATTTSENPGFDNQFGSNYLVTYLQMRPDVDMDALTSKMPEFLLRYMPPDDGSVGTVNDYYKLFFQQLSAVHLASMDIEHDYHNHRKFNGLYLGVFTLVGLLILIIASVNFMNLITARASYRWKEVGVRKTIGALKNQLFTQFSFESSLLGLLAFFFGLVLAFAFIPFLNKLLDRTLSLVSFFDHPLVLVVAFLSTVAIGLLAGIYPSYYLSSFKTVNILRGGHEEKKKSMFRSFLVVLQFGLAISMIICTFIVVQQLYYVLNKDIGFNKDHIVLLDMNEAAVRK